MRKRKNTGRDLHLLAFCLHYNQETLNNFSIKSLLNRYNL